MSMDAANVLELWERAEPLDAIGRAVTLATAVSSGVSIDEVAGWPLGRRDERLLAFRQALSGSTVEAVTSCPHCGADIEFDVDPAPLRTAEPNTATPPPVVTDGWTIIWRAITSDDLAAASTAGTVAAAEAVLLACCMTSVEPPVGAGPPSQSTPETLPTSVRSAVAAALAGWDPLCEVLVDLTCPHCAAEVVAELDVAGFAWSELAGRARRVLSDVDTLARAYGWSEPEVMALGDRRRAAYVRLARERSS